MRLVHYSLVAVGGDVDAGRWLRWFVDGRETVAQLMDASESRERDTDACGSSWRGTH